jgi:putative transferase (TIGR04331 family)
LTSYLITTTDRSRWPDSGHLVFIGTFCLPNDSDLLLDKYTYEIADTAVTSDNKLRCFQLSESVHVSLSVQIADALNQSHQCSKSTRYWEILTGSWLRLFIDLLISRIFIVAKLREMYPDIQLVFAEGIKSRRAPFNTADFHSLTKSTEWNSLVYADLWNTASAEHIASTDRTTRPARIHPKPQSSKLSGYVLSATYLPRMQELLLQLQLGTKYKRLRVINPPAIPVDDKARQHLVFNESQSNDVERLIIKLLRGYLPTSFLEGFAALRMSICRMGFPNNPKAVFTSNRHIYDDVFNAWVADTTEHGSRLILGQHGGHYGISKFHSFAERHEKSVSDLYLTWGWKPSSSSVGGIILTTVGWRWKHRESRSRLLLVTDELWSQPRAVYADIPETSGYLDHLGLLVRSLPTSIQQSLELRQHSGQRVVGHPVENWWRNQLPTINLGDPLIPFSQVVRNAKIVIVAHNGTTIPENFSQAIPTLITWTSNWVEIRDEAKPIFAKLAEVGIFHEDPVSLAKHVSAIWDNVDAWWESKEVVGARELFCSQYARSVPQPRKFLREIIVGKSTMEQQGDLS